MCQELVEIDENLARAELHYAERGPLLARRKELHEIKHPGTTQKATKQKLIPNAKGKAKKNPTGTTESEVPVESPRSFVQEASEKTGIAPTQVYEDLTIAQKVIPPLLDILDQEDVPKRDAQRCQLGIIGRLASPKLGIASPTFLRITGRKIVNCIHAT